MKLTEKQKIEIYQKRKQGTPIPCLSLEYGINKSGIKYLVCLIDAHGLDIVKHDYHRYTPEFKLNAINRVLINQESINSVSINLGLSNIGTLPRWIKEYTENGYTVVEKKRGRKSHGKEDRQSAGGKQSTEGRKCEATQAERDSYDTTRILKKIRCLSNGKREARKEEIAQAVTELRHETKQSLSFILNAINSSDTLPHITRSDYYYWCNHTDADWKYDDLMNRIITIFYTHKARYGYRRMTLALWNEGIHVNHKLVQRLMNKMGLLGVTPKAKYKSYKGDMHGTVKNLLLDKVVDEEEHKTYYNRNFSTTTVNEKWTTDVSEFHIAAGKLYLSPILDMYNHEIISYNLSTNPNFAQTMDMLDKAFKQYPNLKGLIFHSDQGWQYQMQAYHKKLKDKGIIQSMSRKGNCLDNCVMENFFGKLKNEMFYGHEFEFKTIEQLKGAIEEYINYYNTERIQTSLKGLTPCQARIQALKSI